MKRWKQSVILDEILFVYGMRVDKLPDWYIIIPKVEIDAFIVFKEEKKNADM